MSETPDDEVSELLSTWGLSDLKAKFKANYIVIQALEFLTEDDIVELIPKIGQRAIFRGRLLNWRQQNGIAAPPPLKKCKIEPITEPAPEPVSTEKVDQKPATPKESPPQIVHKIYGTLTKCSPPPKKHATNASRPNIQSKVQQFYISPVVEAPPAAQTMAQSKPSIPNLLPPAPEIAPALEPAPLLAVGSAPTPFVTSIIRVETNCDKAQGNSKMSPSNAPMSVNRTTILQRLNDIERTPIPQSENSCQETFEPTIPKIEPPCQVQYETPEQLESNLYPVVKLEAEVADTTNWNDFTEPDLEPVPELAPVPELKPLLIPVQTPDVEPEDVMADSTSLQTDYIESLDSDSAADFDSENDPITYPLGRIAPDPVLSKIPKRRRKRRSCITGKLDIRNILMNSDMGRHVLNFYEANECLDIGRRRILIDVIVQSCWLADKHFCASDCEGIATEIIEILPNERLEDYYSVEPGKSPKSPIYNKYRNMYRRFLLDKDKDFGKNKKSNKNPTPYTAELDDDIIIS